MKYTPSQYAKAFARTLSEIEKKTQLDAEGREREEEKLVKNFVSVIEKHGDASAARKILEATIKAARAVKGGRMITFITARQYKSSLHDKFRKILRSRDTIQEKIDPSLVGGVKILVDDYMQFDGSLKRKMDKIFTDN